MNISKPKFINSYARACLDALQESGLGKYIVLGGAFGLAHYYEYRGTKDIDAWWTEQATETDKEKVVALIQNTLEKFGEVKIRRFGDVVSIDLYKEGQAVFNFQIAARSALLRKPRKSPWKSIALDSLEDLVASKMTALIERGAPRDFLDIYQLCRQNLVAIEKCWKLWQERELKRGRTSSNSKLGCEGLLLHLSRIEKMRPLDSIDDPEKRQQANDVRAWFKNEFCKNRLD